MHKARMVGVFTVREMPEELLPFLNIQAKRENKELKLSEKVSVFQIENTSSFVVAFLSTLKSADEMEKRLNDQDATLEPVSKRSLASVLERS